MTFSVQFFSLESFARLFLVSESGFKLYLASFIFQFVALKLVELVLLAREVSHILAIVVFLSVMNHGFLSKLLHTLRFHSLRRYVQRRRLLRRPLRGITKGLNRLLNDSGIRDKRNLVSHVRLYLVSRYPWNIFLALVNFSLSRFRNLPLLFKLRHLLVVGSEIILGNTSNLSLEFLVFEFEGFDVVAHQGVEDRNLRVLSLETSLLIHLSLVGVLGLTWLGVLLLSLLIKWLLQRKRHGL